MVPKARFPPITPLTDHVTVVVLVPLTLAANCNVWPTRMVDDGGNIDTEMATAAFGASRRLLLALLPQPRMKPDRVVVKTDRSSV
jgi:hypothetical protein